MFLSFYCDYAYLLSVYDVHEYWFLLLRSLFSFLSVLWFIPKNIICRPCIPVLSGLHPEIPSFHYGDAIMGVIASQITSLTIVCSTVYSHAYQRKHQSSASLAFLWGIHRGPVNSPHKWPVTRKMFPFDDVIMRFIPNCSTPCLSSSFMSNQVTWEGVAIWVCFIKDLKI